MRILLVTSSARGHALAEALVRSAHQPEIISICPQRNPGIRKLAAAQYVHDILDFPFILEKAQEHACGLAVIGPDDPIGHGIADYLEEAGIQTVAPRKALARIESSKGFAREVMSKYGIDASPKFRIFTAADNGEMEEYITNTLGGAYVVKYDGLKGGKGVKVSGDHLKNLEEGLNYANECIVEGGQVVLEEKLTGVEFSLLSFVSGTNVVHMPAVQDHKRAYENDSGPNTGGMGTYTDANGSLPFLSKTDIAAAKELNERVAAALQEECGHPYKGILYGGFMAVSDGVRVIEYNARFGDPEALNLLSILESDFVDICLAIANGTLQESHIRFAPLATVCKYITPLSYPDAKTEKGKRVEFPEISSQCRLYFGDISEADDGSLLLGGSRTAGIVGIGKTIAEAEANAQAICEQVQGPVRFRKDIGTQALISKRKEMMDSLRTRHAAD